MENNEFLQQFGGSATANLVSAILFMVYKFFESRCKHSRCSSDTSCFKCSADNYETKRATSIPTTIKEDGIRHEKSLQKLHKSHDSKIQQGCTSPIQVRFPESDDHTRNFQLVTGVELV